MITRIRRFLRAGEIKREPVDLPRLLDELLRMLQGMLVDAEVQVECRIGADLPELIADAVQIQQVILNLVVNAVEAMREGTGANRKLTLEVFPSQGATQLRVSDNGPGVPADMHGRLFDAFFSSKPNGLGMGLAISRSIIENHGGSLWLHASSAAGSCFAFTLGSVDHHSAAPPG